MELIKAKFRKYFLEILHKQEVEEIELRIILDAKFSEELEQIEIELIEDYLENTLSAEEKKLFETNYLVTVERHKNLQFLKSLKEIAQSEVEKEEIAESSPNLFDKLSNLFKFPKFAFVIVVVCLLLTFGVFWRFTANGNKLNSEIVTLNQKDLSNLDEYKGLTNLSLASGTLRSAIITSSLSESSITEKVLLRLALPNITNSPESFGVKISKDGQVFYSLNQTTYQNQEVRLLLPKSILSKGDYQITLEKGTEKFNYYFVVL